MPLAGFSTAALATDANEPFVRQGKGYGYTFVPPPGFAPGKKPVQTHLDEVNFNLEDGSAPRYTYGVTVDPVRISTLAEFGKPEEVAARVVTAEQDPTLVGTFADPAYDAVVERVVLVTVEAFDWNCPQHITERFTVKELETYLAPLRGQLAALHAENAQLREKLDRGE